jgi:nitroreductase
MPDYQYLPLSGYREYPEDKMRDRVRGFYDEIKKRRSVRHFSSRPVPIDVIETCLAAAGTAPSGAHKQPWHFVVVTEPALKREIRTAAEKEERAFYEERAPDDWLTALAPLGTDASKPFLENAPCLIVIFAKSYEVEDTDVKTKNYYVQESVGIATGLLLTAIQYAGLVSLTHTPSPMGFLNDILHRPGNERPYLVLVVGYPAGEATVPDLQRKSLHEIATFL